MSGPFRPRHRPWRWFAAWVVLLGLVALGSLVPAGAVPIAPIAGVDKLQHLVGHGLLSAYAAMLFAPRHARALAVAWLVAYGIGIEAAQQALTATREADAADVVANLLGVLLGQAVAFTPAVRWMARADARMHR